MRAQTPGSSGLEGGGGVKEDHKDVRATPRGHSSGALGAGEGRLEGLESPQGVKRLQWEPLTLLQRKCPVFCISKALIYPLGVGRLIMGYSFLVPKASALWTDNNKQLYVVEAELSLYPGEVASPFP